MNFATSITEKPRIYAIIVAAGTGSRAGGEVPKQYQRIAGKKLLRYSAEVLAHHPAIAGVQVVIHPNYQAYYNELKQHVTVLPAAFGGATRTESVAAGLEALSLYHPDYVLIHDAARPFLSSEIIDGLLEKLTPDRAAVPTLPVADTVRRYAEGAWSEVPRDGLMRIQTPQAFPYAALKKIYETATPGTTDDAALWLAAGHDLAYIPGAEELRKVTTANDMEWAKAHATPLRRTAVGLGFDVHAFVPAAEDGNIRIGGINIPSMKRLHGHSDADVVLHALVDALLGAIGDGDIGQHFNPSDERWRGADSRQFVAEALARVTARGGIIEHVDVTIIGERPKIAPHREAMREALAQMLHLPLAYVSIKATTTEKLGFTGREEGLAAQAVASVSLPQVLA